MENNPPKLAVWRDIDRPPAPGWVFMVAETGTKLEAASARSLADKVWRHMESNEIVPPYPFQPWFEDEACRQSGLGEPWCGPAASEGMTGKPMLNRESVARFLRTMWLLFKRGFKLVGQDVAEQRAAVCVACPANVKFPLSCWKCTALLAIVGKIIGTRKTAVDDKLEWCGCCGCRCQLKVWIPKKVLRRGEKGQKISYEQGCWVIKDD